MCWTLEYFAFPQNLLFEHLMYSASSLVVSLQKAMEVNPTTWAAASAPPVLQVSVSWDTKALVCTFRFEVGPEVTLWVNLPPCSVRTESGRLSLPFAVMAFATSVFSPSESVGTTCSAPILWVPGRCQRVVLIVCNVNTGMTEKIARVTLSWRQAVLIICKLATCECHGRDAGPVVYTLSVQRSTLAWDFWIFCLCEVWFPCLPLSLNTWIWIFFFCLTSYVSYLGMKALLVSGIHRNIFPRSPFLWGAQLV